MTEHSTSPKPEPDERVLGAYRAANEALDQDQRPAAAVRAAVLAAAAREVGARPQPVGRRPRWRAPLAAAASLLVGTLAIVLATRHDDAPQTVVTTEEKPAAPAAPAATGGASPAPVLQPPARAAREEAAPSVSTSTAPAPPRPKLELRAPEPTSQAAARDQEAPAPAATVPAAPPAASVERGRADAAMAPSEAEAARKQAEPALPQQGSLAAAPAAAPQAANAAAAGRALEALPEPPATPAQRQMSKEAKEQHVTARPVARSGPVSDVPGPPLSADEARRWIERIVELRRAGRDAEADAELRALRQRDPNLAVPPEALPRPAPGTR